MGEADRKEFIQRQLSVAELAEQMFKRLYKNEPLVPLMHKILAKTDISDEQKFRNAMRINKELDFVRDGPVKSELYEKTQPIIADLYDTHHKKTKHLPDDENFWVLVEPVERPRDPIDAARETVVDVAEESWGFWGSVAKVGGAIGAGALATAKTGFNLAMDAMPNLQRKEVEETEEVEEDMKAKQKVLLDRFAYSISSGQLSVEEAAKIYRAKSVYDKGESYMLGIQTLAHDPGSVAHSLTPEQLEEIQSKYSQWESPRTTKETKLRWPNATRKRKAPDETVTNQETSIEGPGDPPAPEPKYSGAKYALGVAGAAIGAVAASTVGVSLLTGAALGGAVSFMNAADNENRDNENKYLPKINGPETLPKEPVPEDPYDYDYSNFQTESDNLLAQQRAERERKDREKKQKLDDEMARMSELPTIPVDSAQYSIKPELDTTQAALAGIQQFLTKASLSGGGMLTQRLLSMGGPYGYLGAAAVGAGTLTLDSMNRHFSEHYTKPYSERRGVHMANQLYGGFPALSAERSINSLESSSLGERSNTNVVNVFAKQGSQLGGRGYNLVQQENTALQSFLQESQSPFVVPH